MEVATSNNHNHDSNLHNFRDQHQYDEMPEQLNAANSNGTSGGHSPFQREVREWQHIDPDTGALLTGRVEADRWINGPLNSYGKISDSQNISQPNGTQHTQRKQLEVLQARTANGAMQVIRTQKVQTTSSRRWSSSTTATASTFSPMAMQLQLPLPQSSISEPSLTNGHHHEDLENSIHFHHNHNHTNKVHDAPNLHNDEYRIKENGDNRYDGGGGGESGSTSRSSSDSSINRNINILNNFNNNYHNVDSESNATIINTTPSLKLSNLMRSSSSISSNNSSNSLTSAVASMKNTYNSTAKVSLNSIVNSSNTSQSDSQSPTSSTAKAALWQKQSQPQQQQQHLKQYTIFGSNDNGSKNLKSHVGVTNTLVASNGSNADDAFVDKQQSQHHHQLATGEKTPTPQLNRQQKLLQHQTRRDLESFRHHNSPTSALFPLSAKGSADSSDLKQSNGNQKQYSQYPESNQSLTSLQRARSISTDDLSTEWDTYNQSVEEPSEWRRVSKLRRSFQATSATSAVIVPSDSQRSQVNPKQRPVDLPANSVSVSKICAELENGRRLNTAMRSNHVDLAALNTILNAPSEEDQKVSSKKKSSFLTAESLKEIRGKLKRLSDESLYRDDFIAHQQPPVEDEQIEVQHHVRKTPERQLKPVKSTIQSEPKTPLKYIPSAIQKDSHTHSLETRQKYKDTSSNDWHNRRKSYGFEKMSPPIDKAMFRMDASTDSGLGRSSDFSNWSPTTEKTPAVRSTIVHFGEPVTGPINSVFPKRREYLNAVGLVENENDSQKRHSIAVDESQYIGSNGRKTSQVHINGFQKMDNPTTNVGDDNTAQSNASSTLFQKQTQQKRVEFCKTEVHFAAESGRVNIVETDGKPPPTNNFRRRRRVISSSTSPLQSLVKEAPAVSTIVKTNALSLANGSDDHIQRRKTIAGIPVTESLLESVEETSNVTVSMPQHQQLYHGSMIGSRASYTSTSGVDTTDNENDESTVIRGILKNKPAKPKPYHLGENINSPDALWNKQATTTTEAQNPNAILSRDENRSIGENFKIIEKRQDAKNHSYSTKIKLNLGEGHKQWNETGYREGRDSPQPTAQELILNKLREHQKILDKGLKSTSLIIRTMRSASEFDEAMRRLSIASIESAVIQPYNTNTTMHRANSYEESMQSNYLSSCDNNDFQTLKSTNMTTAQIKPMVAPRLKLLGNTEIPVSEQLYNLRRLCDATNSADESADEEVRSYFRGNAGNSDGELTDNDKSFKYSNSWSRLKTKRSTWKTITETKQQSEEENLVSTEIPSTNVMNIALHSPKVKPEVVKRTITPPVAKPRSITNLHKEDHQRSLGESAKTVTNVRGARELKDHELAYFGIQISNSQNSTKNTESNLSNIEHNSTLTPITFRHGTMPRKLNKDDDEHQTNSTIKVTTNYQLINDNKPDLLRHSPIVIKPQIRTSLAEIQSTKHPVKRTQSPRQEIRSPVQKILEFEEEPLTEDDEHFYENVSNVQMVKNPTKPIDLVEQYDRKTDVQRDAMILSEMTQSADQSMKDLFDTATSKSQRRRSLQRRNSQPLETIDEKVKSREKRSPQKCIAVEVTRVSHTSKPSRSTQQSTSSPSTPTMASRARTSSQSSIESCPRTRSRSLSSERDYENVAPQRVRSKSVRGTTKKISSCSSSRESLRSLHTPCSSGDEMCIRARERELRKAKRSLNDSRKSTETHRIKDSSNSLEKKKLLIATNDKHHRPTRTLHSSQKERNQCTKESKSSHSTKIGEKMASSHNTRIGHVQDLHKPTTPTTEIRKASNNGIRPLRSSRSHQEKDKSKEKRSRSKDHSSHSTRTHSKSSEIHDAAKHKSSTMKSSTTRREHKKLSTDTSRAVTPIQEKNPNYTGRSSTTTDQKTQSKNHQYIEDDIQQNFFHKQPHEHVHKLTTATIATKHHGRLRSGKDRK